MERAKTQEEIEEEEVLRPMLFEEKKGEAPFEKERKRDEEEGEKKHAEEAEQEEEETQKSIEVEKEEEDEEVRKMAAAKALCAVDGVEVDKTAYVSRYYKMMVASNTHRVSKPPQLFSPEVRVTVRESQPKRKTEALTPQTEKAEKNRKRKAKKQKTETAPKSRKERLDETYQQLWKEALKKNMEIEWEREVMNKDKDPEDIEQAITRTKAQFKAQIVSKAEVHDEAGFSPEGKTCAACGSSLEGCGYLIASRPSRTGHLQNLLPKQGKFSLHETCYNLPEPVEEEEYSHHSCCLCSKLLDANEEVIEIAASRCLKTPVISLAHRQCVLHADGVIRYSTKENEFFCFLLEAKRNKSGACHLKCKVPGGKRTVLVCEPASSREKKVHLPCLLGEIAEAKLIKEELAVKEALAAERRLQREENVMMQDFEEEEEQETDSDESEEESEEEQNVPSDSGLTLPEQPDDMDTWEEPQPLARETSVPSSSLSDSSSNHPRSTSSTFIACTSSSFPERAPSYNPYPSASPSAASRQPGTLASARAEQRFSVPNGPVKLENDENHYDLRSPSLPSSPTNSHTLSPLSSAATSVSTSSALPVVTPSFAPSPILPFETAPLPYSHLPTYPSPSSYLASQGMNDSDRFYFRLAQLAKKKLLLREDEAAILFATKDEKWKEQFWNSAKFKDDDEDLAGLWKDLLSLKRKGDI